jgi:hypothetical protein
VFNDSWEKKELNKDEKSFEGLFVKEKSKDVC